MSYLVDTYLMLAASALAANMFMRSILAAAFPYSHELVGGTLNSLGGIEQSTYCDLVFHNLGLNWGMSLLGFIAAAMIPHSLPVCFRCRVIYRFSSKLTQVVPGFTCTVNDYVLSGSDRS